MAKKKTTKKKTVYINKRLAGNLNDVYGIILFSLSLLLFVFLYTEATGVVGTYSNQGLTYLLGSGRFFLPLALLIWALYFIFNKKIREINLFGYGLLICFLSLITLFHVSFELKEMFADVVLKEGGGVAGGVFAYIFKYMLGTTGAYIALVTAFIVGLVLTTNVNISELSTTVIDRIKLYMQQFKEKERRPVVNQQQLKEPTPKGDRKIQDVSKNDVEFDHHLPDEQEPEDTEKETQIIEEPASDGPYNLPPVNMLKRTSISKGLLQKKNVKENIRVLEKTLHDFGVDAGVSKVVTGPTVTRYEVHLASGVKVNRLLGLADDISYAFASPDVRILAPIPGKSAIGIEVPNIHRQLVTIGDILNTPDFKKDSSILNIVIGKDITGHPVFADLASMPHLLIAGATGSGKSVCINSLLTSLLCRATPEQLKMILIDPKRVELAFFNDIPHLAAPVVTNPKNAANALAWAVGEMERRYEIFHSTGVKNIKGYNSLKNKPEDGKNLPYIIVVIDELADLMMVAAREVEDAICRLAQLARATGIHLVIATQRPSTDVITGLIKANIICRIAFAVGSMTDSRVILDTGGAEKLVGKGDMLFLTPEVIKPRRLQAAFVGEKEIESVTGFIKAQAKPEYIEDITAPKKASFGVDDFDDELLDDAMDIIVRSKKASVSYLQRRLRIGYGRAARLMDMLEEKGVVSEQDGSRPREVLITEDELEEVRS
ncbi:MAG: DNA translocase FtsK [Actinobacteria bacterium]|nr:MAG: DNA translocase FtsK [Actinomycetota bacterium]